MFRSIDIMIDIIFFSIIWKKYFDRSILVISMTVLKDTFFGVGRGGGIREKKTLFSRVLGGEKIKSFLFFTLVFSGRKNKNTHTYTHTYGCQGPSNEV